MAYKTFDFGIDEDFSMPWEGHKVTLRADMFNAFNHVQYGFPSSVITNTNFGAITGVGHAVPAAQHSGFAAVPVLIDEIELMRILAVLRDLIAARVLLLSCSGRHWHLRMCWRRMKCVRSGWCARPSRLPRRFARWSIRRLTTASTR